MVSSSEIPKVERGYQPQHSVLGFKKQIRENFRKLVMEKGEVMSIDEARDANTTIRNAFKTGEISKPGKGLTGQTN
jgi:hypothetical protein